MDLETNQTSLDSNHGSTRDTKQDAQKHQFTMKQRMDMYAFCVLELELHGNTVSIKKQEQAIQRALKRKGALGKSATCSAQLTNNSSSVSNGTRVNVPNEHHHQSQHGQPQMNVGDSHPSPQQEICNTQPTSHNTNTPNDQSEHQFGSFPQHHQLQSNPPSATSSALMQQTHAPSHEQQQPTESMGVGGDNNLMTTTNGEAAEKKTFLELKEEFAKTQRCYSDYQKTQVLTTNMLREVQRRFAKYYPDTHCPSRTTIKHVFMKCVENGTVENVKNPRKPTKIPNGDEIEQFLLHEPQMSLREMAKKLNVSTGTVSRRCRALGIVPESVTLKHQQMAVAKRQKHMKQQTAGQPKTQGKRASTGGSRKQQATSDHHDQYTNGMV